jgi:hypothetical protein
MLRVTAFGFGNMSLGMIANVMQETGVDPATGTVVTCLTRKPVKNPTQYKARTPAPIWIMRFRR